jgi:hypothetical protein
MFGVQKKENVISFSNATLGQSPTKVIMVRDTLPYGHAPTYQISLTYLETKMLWPGQENTI